MKYLRNIVDGTIYEWNELLAVHPKCEPVTEEQAFPERFLRPEVVAEVKKRGRPPLALKTENIPTPPPIENEALNKDASRRGFAIAGTAGVKPTAPVKG